MRPFRRRKGMWSCKYKEVHVRFQGVDVDAQSAACSKEIKTSHYSTVTVDRETT
jgi:hypothetical protein